MSASSVILCIMISLQVATMMQAKVKNVLHIYQLYIPLILPTDHFLFLAMFKEWYELYRFLNSLIPL